jgi:hypothetical protein
MEDKKPDHIVFNEETGEYDAKKKAYPTSLSAPSFQPIIYDNTEAVKASKYFMTKFDEIQTEYHKLIREWEDTKKVYDAAYSFSPITGKTYHLYARKDEYFLSLIGPKEWNKPYIGSYKLTTDGKWESAEETNDEK